MELLIIVIVAFLIGKAFGGKKKRRRDEWPDEPVEYKPSKKKGCFSRILSLAFWAFASIVILAFVDSIGDVDSSSDVSAPPAVSATSAVRAEPTPKPTSAPTIAPTATPSTREELVQIAAESVYGDGLISVSWQEVDNQKDMIVIWCKFKDNFTKQMRRDGFMIDAKNMFKRVAKLGADGFIEYGSCYIVGRTTYLDSYGNEFDGNAMEIRLTSSDLEKINWDNINSDMIINLAAPYAVHPLFRD